MHRMNGNDPHEGLHTCQHLNSRVCPSCPWSCKLLPFAFPLPLSPLFIRHFHQPNLSSSNCTMRRFSSTIFHFTSQAQSLRLGSPPPSPLTWLGNFYFFKMWFFIDLIFFVWWILIEVRFCCCLHSEWDLCVTICRFIYFLFFIFYF